MKSQTHLFSMIFLTISSNVLTYLLNDTFLFKLVPHLVKSYLIAGIDYKGTITIIAYFSIAIAAYACFCMLSIKLSFISVNFFCFWYALIDAAPASDSRSESKWDWSVLKSFFLID